MRREPIVKVFSQPGLNEMDGPAFEADKVRMSNVRLNRRPTRNRPKRSKLTEQVDAEERKEHLERNRRFSFELPSHGMDFK